MKKFSLLAVAFLVLAPASSAFAAGYGAAGCGWGGKVIKGNDILSQLGAATLNNYLPGSQTFAMSSGTLGCKTSSFTKAQFEQNIFPLHRSDLRW